MNLKKQNKKFTKTIKNNSMKKYLVLIAIALLPFAGFSQSIFDKFEDMDEVSSVIVNKNMFDLLVKMDVNVDEPEAREAM